MTKKVKSKKTPAKKTGKSISVKKTTKKVAKKPSAKKVAKKPAAKKAAKKVTKKAPAKKPAAKKPVAKKVTKKPVAKKQQVKVTKPVKKVEEKKNEPIISILEHYTEHKQISPYEFEQIQKRIIEKAQLKKRNKNVVVTKKVFDEFGTYVLSKEQAFNLLNAILKAGVSFKEFPDKKEFTQQECETILSQQKGQKVSKADAHMSKPSDRDGVKSFLRTLGLSKMLTAEEEIKYAKMLESKNPIIKKFATDQLVTSNLRLVTSIAKRFLNRGIEFEDLIQEGTSGLMKAITKYDYRLGHKFSTYATWWIRQAITRAISDQSKVIRIPAHMVETINHVIKAEKELTQVFGRQPTIDEITEELGGQAKGFTPRKVANIKRVYIEPISLDKTVGSDEDSQIADFVKETSLTNPDQFTKEGLLKEDIDQLFKVTLTKEEEKIMRMRYGLAPYPYAHSLDEVADEIHLPREQIRQIEAKATRKLKHPSKSKKLRAYILDESN